MKKVIALFLAIAMMTSLAGCSKVKDAIKDKVGDVLSEATSGLSDQISDALGGDISDALGGISDALGGIGGDLSGSISDALGGIGTDISDALGNAVNDAAGAAADGAADAIISAAGRHSTQYWAEKYSANYCPFSISTLGIEIPYHFRDGGQLDFWVYTEENTSGWYVYNGYIISNDNAFALKIDEIDSLSSCCTYNAKAYTGESLTKEEREGRDCGIFHILNSYTPARVHWGIKFFGEENHTSFDECEYGVYDLPESLFDQEYFNFYMPSPDFENPEAIKLWAFKHRNYTEYPEILSEDDVKSGIQLGVFTQDNDNHCYYLSSFVPNEMAGGFPEGCVDLLVTYGDDENVTVGVLTVYTGVGGKG